MPTKLKKLEITKVDLCRAGADPDADIAIFKSRDHDLTPPVEPVKKENRMSKKVAKIDLTTAKPEEIVEYAKSLETQVTEQEALIAKAVKKDPVEPDADDEDAKAAAKVVAKKLDDQAEEIRKTNAKNVELEAEIKKERTAREMSDIRKSVETTMPKIPGTIDEVVKMLHEAQTSLSKESFVVLEKALKAGSEAISKAAKEIGGDGSTVSSAMDEINKKADALVTAGTVKTRAEAITEVAKSNPELYQKYKQEKKKAA